MPFVYLCSNRAAPHKGAEIVQYPRAAVLQEIIYGIVSGCVHPVVPGPCRRLVHNIVHYVPGVHDLRAAEPVPVIPIKGGVIPVFIAVIFKQLPDFVPCEAEVFTEGLAQNSAVIGAVRPGEEAVIREHVDPRKDCEFQVGVAFQGIGEHQPYEAFGLVIIAVPVCGVEGRVILVYEHDGLFAAVQGNQPGQPLERFFDAGLIRPPSRNGIEQFPVFRIEFGACGNLFPLLVRIRHDIFNLVIALFPTVCAGVLQGYANDRILAHMLCVIRSAGPDFLVLEICGLVLPGVFKECPEHVHGECLAESPGPCKYRNRAFFVQQVPD